MGPIGALLATIPEASYFSVGALLARLADLGSNNPERFGCCHGKEQVWVWVTVSWQATGMNLMLGLGRLCSLTWAPHFKGYRLHLLTLFSYDWV